MGVGRRLYHSGSPRGPAYESHPWRKGWPTVAPDAVSYTLCCVTYVIIVAVGVGYDGEPMCAMLGHAC